MVSVTNQQATALADMMKKGGAYKATTEEVEIHGLRVQVVILDHDDQREGEWQTVHVLGHQMGSVEIGVLQVKG